MGLSWQQGPPSPGAIGRFLVPEPLPKRLFIRRAAASTHARALRGAWIADSEQVILLFEPDRYPVAYFPKTDIATEALQLSGHSTRHPDLGPDRELTVIEARPRR
jgi:uncharacterized protein (DUF427 family)